MTLSSLENHSGPFPEALRNAMRRCPGFVMGTVLALPGVVRAESSAAWTGQIRPLLEAKCFDCHADGAEKGGVAFAGLFQKMRDAKVPVECHVLAQGGHAFNMGTRSKLATIKGWPLRLSDWLTDNILAPSGS